MKHDVVYLLKNDYTGGELRFSVRSVVKNFPHNRIVFVGGFPEDIGADIRIYDKQIGDTKWERSMHSLKVALDNDDLTDDIWLFNDDFFVMNKVSPEINFFGGTLGHRISELKRSLNRTSGYCRNLEEIRRELALMGKDTLSFALHLPMLINRYKALRLFEQFPKTRMFRSFYGNYYEIPCVYSKDVKVYDNYSVPNWDYLSTTDESFQVGKVGEFIRASFPDPCKYEDVGQVPAHHKELYTEEGDEIT